MYSKGTIDFDIEIYLKDKPVQIALEVLTDFKNLDADIWESLGEIGKKFPLEFRSACISSIQTQVTNT